MNRHERRAAQKTAADAAKKSASMAQPGPFRKLLETKPPLTPQDLRTQRVELMQKIAAIRGRPLVVYATKSGINLPGIAAYIHREDIVPFAEVLESVDGDKIDVLLETPGGLAEVTIELVNLLRPRFAHVLLSYPTWQ